MVVPARGTLIAAGDLHDNPVNLARLRHLAGLDESRPEGGSHLVVHELIHGDRLVDGVDLSHRILLRASMLILQHPLRVHVLLANHEIAQLVRRGVSKGAGDSVQLFRDGLEYVFGDAATEVEPAVDEFFRALPLALRSEPDARGRTVLCAHSLPGPAAMRHFDIGVYGRPLAEADYAAPQGAAYLATWGRGLDAEHLRDLGSRLGASLFCLGHQHAETGVELLSPNAVVINSDHERACAIPLDLEAIPEAEEAVLAAVPLASLGDMEPRGPTGTGARPCR